ncbi:MAG TPA: alpha/beta hydrolase [Thermoanaerobaculia bacterium]|nr:alpha/beta hydrolase [Thermoanaerobaculia bacterium]
MARKLAIAGTILGAAVVAVEIAARVTREAHNRQTRALGDQLLVTVAGNGPPVIFLHGLRGSGRYWEPHVRKLTASHQIVIVDLLGFGRSPWPAESSYSVDEHLDAIHRSVAPLVRGRPATVVGHSMGAILAAEYARVHPSEVSQLVLVNPPLFRSTAEARAKVRGMSPMAALFSIQPFLARAGCDLVCAFRPLLARYAPHAQPDIPPDVARDAVMHRWESFDRSLRNVVLGSHLEETLTSLAPLPVTIVHGTDDRISERERLVGIAEKIGANVYFLPGDHNLYLRRPEEVIELIEAALQRNAQR